jgi:hypothetical protein
VGNYVRYAASASLAILFAATLLVLVPITIAASFDFALKFEPEVVAIRQGQYALAEVSVGTISGQPSEVILTYTIPPVPGLSAKLDRTKGIPLFKSTLRIDTTTQTPPGTYTINVAGVAGTVTRIASVTLKLESALTVTTATTAGGSTATTRPTSVAATLTQPVSTAETGEADKGAGRALSGGWIYLVPFAVVVIAVAAYYFGKRSKPVAVSEPTPKPPT